MVLIHQVFFDEIGKFAGLMKLIPGCGSFGITAEQNETNPIYISHYSTAKSMSSQLSGSLSVWLQGVVTSDEWFSLSPVSLPWKL